MTLTRWLLSRIPAIFLIATCVPTGSAQQVAPLPKTAAALRRKVGTLTPHAPISVIRVHAEEEYGNFMSSDQEGFTFYDVDRKADVTLKYIDVRKIRDGYGGYNSFGKKHTDHTKAIIIGAVVMGGLVALIAAAAVAN
jgi:hypothetical protein